MDAAAWLEAQVGALPPTREILTVGYPIIAACAFTNATSSQVFMTWAGKGVWARPDVLRAWLTHAFITLGSARAVGMIEGGNERAIRFAVKIGGVDTGRRHKQSDGTLLHEFEMRPATCRWLK